MQSRAQWLRAVHIDGCETCHQLGNKATRELSKNLGTFDSSTLAWERRVQSGQAGAQMLNGLNNIGKPRALAMYADWTDRIAKGELPAVMAPSMIASAVCLTSRRSDSMCFI